MNESRKIATRDVAIEGKRGRTPITGAWWTGDGLLRPLLFGVEGQAEQW